MDRLVLFRTAKENRRARKQRMVLSYGPDHFAYVGAYRKCIDEISQYKKEL
jgi:hypothetical protein